MPRPSSSVPSLVFSLSIPLFELKSTRSLSSLNRLLAGIDSISELSTEKLSNLTPSPKVSKLKQSIHRERDRVPNRHFSPFAMKNATIGVWPNSPFSSSRERAKIGFGSLSNPRL